MRRALLAGAAVVAALAGAPAAAQAEDWWTKDGATWTQSYITEPDGTVLHADVLRPADLPLNATTPVVMSVSTYFGHAGEAGVLGSPYDPTSNSPQPDPRWKDLIEGADLFHQGYAFVMVDLRGYGGSTGCLDEGGPGEQADVKNAVQWAAAQPWSNGRVGLYGKSYDGWTALFGEASQPRGLAAIVAMEPLYHPYDTDYIYGVSAELGNDGVTYDAISESPSFTLGDNPQYILNSLNKGRPGCAPLNPVNQANNDRNAPYWQQRDFITASRGHKVPIFLTQGFLENNTKPLGAWDFFDGLKGPKKAWFAMSDHIRGNDVAEGDGAASQPFFGAVMRWYNHYLKGVPFSDPAGATDRDPAVAVETSDGSWRAEQQWPPLDSTASTVKVTPGSYTDGYNAADAEDAGSNLSPTGDTTGAGDWTISPPLDYPAHLAGVPSAALDVTAQLPRSDLSVLLYDIKPSGTATLVSRTAYLLVRGEQQIYPEMYGNDWLFAARDRVGILVTSASDGWFQPQPNRGTVTVNPGSVVTLPWLRYQRPADRDLSGYKVPARLGVWNAGAGQITVPAATIASATAPGFALPAPATPAPGGFNAGAIGMGVGFHSDGLNASPGALN